MDYLTAYAAGFFDGEGCITISRVNGGRFSDNHRILVTAAQKIEHATVLYELQARWGGVVRIRERSKKNPKWSDVAEWNLRSRESISAFISDVLPLLRIKRTQAEIALQFIAQAGVKRPKRNAGRFTGSDRLTDADIEAREGFRLAIQRANQRGPVNRAS